MSALVTKSQTHRALNQLTALIVGAKFARETKSYENDPRERLNHCYKAIMKEQEEALGDHRRMGQVSRKADAMRSLLTLARLAEEVEWE